MTFNEHGYLPQGLHEMSLDDIEGNFVDSFPSSNTRPHIMRGYKQHVAALASLGVTFEQFLDGSFISTKNDPGDVDFVCFANPDDVDRLPPEQQTLLRSLVLNPQETKRAYYCDAYFCPIVPENDPRYGQLRVSRKYWMGEFGFDRLDRPKGIVRTRILAAQPSEPGNG